MKQKWTQKPITWGNYAALCVVCYIFSMVMGIYWYIAWFEPEWWTELKAFVNKDRFTKIDCK